MKRSSSLPERKREWMALVRMEAFGFQEELWSTVAHGVIVPASRHWPSFLLEVVFLHEPGAVAV